MGNVRVAHYLASFHKNAIFVKTRYCFIYPPSVAGLGNVRVVNYIASFHKTGVKNKGAKKLLTFRSIIVIFTICLMKKILFR